VEERRQLLTAQLFKAARHDRHEVGYQLRISDNFDDSVLIIWMFALLLALALDERVIHLEVPSSETWLVRPAAVRPLAPPADFLQAGRA